MNTNKIKVVSFIVLLTAIVGCVPPASNQNNASLQREVYELQAQNYQQAQEIVSLKEEAKKKEGSGDQSSLSQYLIPLSQKAKDWMTKCWNDWNEENSSKQ